jgi:hypothetical protein
MRMTVLSILGLLVCCAPLAAQQATIDGSGRVIEASLPASNFNRVDMAAVGNVHITRDNREELRITVEDNLLPYFQTKVVDGVLVIYLNPPVALRPTQPIALDLSVKDLQEIRLSGAATIDAPHLEAAQFSVALTGAGNVTMADFDAQRLTVWMPGAGNVMISGRVDEQDITLAGSGQYQAGTLTSTNAAIRIDGVGSADLQVRDVLHAEIHGAGLIRYGGHPRTVEKSVTGVGIIIAVD